MEETRQQLLNNISSYVGKLLRDHFGKGPESVFVSIGSTFINIYIRNFISPMERVLMEQDQEIIVRELRQKMMNKLLPELRAFIEIMTGQPVRELYYDWGLHNFSGMIFGVAERPFFAQEEEFYENYPGKMEINQLISKISQQAQKAPEETYSCLLNPRTLVVIRKGILVRIEKEFIRLGYTDLLRNVKSNLEKSYLHSSAHFEAILQQRVVEVFVDWDFEMDKSVIVFILNPKKVPGGNELDMTNMS